MTRDEHIIRLYTKHKLGGDAIASLMSVSKCTIYRVLKRHDIPSQRYPNRHAHRLSRVPGNEAEVIRLYQTGLSLASVAERFDVTHVTVLRVLQEAGVQRRRRGGGGSRPFTDEERARIKELRLQKWSTTRIADDLGRAHAGVAEQLRAMGMSEPVKRQLRERVFNSEGYAAIRLAPDDPLFSMVHSNGYATEHRIVMARALGRVLTRSETVHHINGDKADNRLENLQLRQGPHGHGVHLRCVDCGSFNVTVSEL